MSEPPGGPSSVLPQPRHHRRPDDLVSRIRRRRRVRPVRLRLTERVIANVGALVVVFQVINSAQLLALCSAHVDLLLRGKASYLGALSHTFLTTDEQRTLLELSIWNGIVFGIVGLSYVLAVLGLTVRALAARCCGLLLGSRVHQSLSSSAWKTTTSSRRHLRSRRSSDVGLSSMASWRSHPPRELAVKLLDWLWMRLQWLWVTFGIRGKRFEDGFLIREVIDLVVQAVQAYTASRTISNLAINQTYGILLAGSALAHPVVSYLFSEDIAMLRFVTVFVEMFVDFLWATVLPLWMYAPYMTVGASIEYGAAELVEKYPLGFFEAAQQEVRQIVILSPRALFLSVFPFLSSFISLVSVRKLLHAAVRVQPDVIDVQPRMLHPQSNSNDQANGGRNSNAVVPSSPRWTLVEPTLDTPKRIPTQHILLGSCGLLLFTVSSSAVIRLGTTTIQNQCSFPLTPWFVSKDSCVGLQIDCTKLHISGNADELQASLEIVDDRSLQVVGIKNCPRVEMSINLQRRLGDIKALVFRNSSIRTWPLDHEGLAALSTIIFVKGTLDNVYLGVQPLQRLERLAFLQIDASHAFTGITQEDGWWKNLKHFFCNFCSMGRFPASLIHMTSLESLSLMGSKFYEIDITLSLQQNLWSRLESLTLASSSNLTILPDDLWKMVATSKIFERLDIKNTNISIPPRWADQLRQIDTVSISAKGSPICNPTAPGLEIQAVSCV